MKTRRFIALLLALMMLFTLCACGSKTADEAGETVYYVDVNKDDEIPEFTNTMVPEEVLAKLDYTPAMLGGYFDITDKQGDSFAEDYSYIIRSIYDSYNQSVEDIYLSSVPYRISAGVSALEWSNDPIYCDRTHDWAVLTFLTEGGSSEDVLCTVTVSGSTVSYTPVSYYKEVYVESKLSKLEFEVGDKSIDYTFVRGSHFITLTSVDNGESITLNTSWFNSYPETIKLEGYLAEGSDKCADILSFDIYRSDVNDRSNTGFVDVVIEDDSYDRLDAYAAYTGSGLLSLYYVVTANGGHETVFANNFVYIDTGYSCVLVDENGKVYYYTESEDTVSEEVNFDIVEVDDAARVIMEQTRSEILDALVAAMDSEGISFTADYETGEVSLNAGILFDVSSSAISDSGKKILEKFIVTYTSVVFSSEFKKYLSAIVVEGHTDTNGDYDSNMTLSEERAKAVLDYCIGCSSLHGYDEEMTGIMSSVGMSYDRPVLNDDGSVNMDASRRVSFRIVVVIPEE